MRYRREIDGLRAIAVLPVILFHAGFESFSGGFIGVDVFFVISGYLITAILINDLERGGFSILKFYERRARRILPALFTVVLVSIPAGFLLMTPTQMRDFAQSIVAVVLFASNILFWREEGYFAAASELKPLLHTWSLAVEEQYYLLFPLLLFLLWPLGRRRVVWMVIAVAAASLTLSEWGTLNLPGFTFYLAPTRAWELFAGSLCAFATLGRPQRSSDLLSGIGLALIVVAIFGFDRTLPFPGLYALVPVLGTALIIVFAGTGTAVHLLLSTRPLVGIGLISYSAYLWHQPLFAFARIKSLSAPPEGVMMLLSGLSLMLAWGSWRFVEQPFRRTQGPLLPTRRNVFTASAIAAALLVAFGLSGHVNGGFRTIYLALNPGHEADLRLIETARQEAPYQAHGTCVFHSSGVDQGLLDRLRQCSASHGPGVLVLGDSHAIDLFGIVARQTPDDFVIGLSRSGCRPNSEG
ncbi:MAG: acyltransferase, partial [Albidovulum sp.]|uniref:acyltransferase family protein n=1 Tax=Albidovulum sp. TaxID=1872424 RepID=UPI003C89C35F